MTYNVNLTHFGLSNSTSNTAVPIPTAVEWANASYFLHANGTWAVPVTPNTNPGGANTAVQFNDSGAFGGNSNFTFSKTTLVLALSNSTASLSVGNSTVNTVINSTSLVIANTSASNQLTAAGVLPAGLLADFAGNTAPTGWLLCDGSEVSRTTYAALFAAISTTWGAGNGSNTFNLPNFSGRTTVGTGTVTLTETRAAADFNTSDIITVASNSQEAGTTKWQTGMKVQISTDGSLPTGISAATDYYVRRLSATTISLYNSRQAAQNIGNNSNPDVTGRINITATGSGNHTITHTMAARTLGELVGHDMTTAVPNHRHETLGGSSGSGLDGVASSGGSSNRNDGTAYNGETDGVSNFQPSAVVTKIIKT
jgi:microcystin-dependent protein